MNLIAVNGELLERMRTGDVKAMLVPARCVRDGEHMRLLPLDGDDSRHLDVKMSVRQSPEGPWKAKYLFDDEAKLCGFKTASALIGWYKETEGRDVGEMVVDFVMLEVVT